MKQYKGMIVATTERPCIHCQQPAKFVDISFEAPMCSIKCANLMWLEYEESLRRSDEKHAQWLKEQGHDESCLECELCCPGFVAPAKEDDEPKLSFDELHPPRPTGYEKQWNRPY